MFLIIEQNKELGEIYHRLLLNAGYRVLLKRSYKDAINLAEKEMQDISFVIMDAGKNTDSGNVIKILEKFEDSKVCLIFDEITTEIEKIINDFKIALWLVKPFIPSQLLKAIFLLREDNLNVP